MTLTSSPPCVPYVDFAAGDQHPAAADDIVPWRFDEPCFKRPRMSAAFEHLATPASDLQGALFSRGPWPAGLKRGRTASPLLAWAAAAGEQEAACKRHRVFPAFGADACSRTALPSTFEWGPLPRLQCLEERDPCRWPSVDNPRDFTSTRGLRLREAETTAADPAPQALPRVAGNALALAAPYLGAGVAERLLRGEALRLPARGSSAWDCPLPRRMRVQVQEVLVSPCGRVLRAVVVHISQAAETAALLCGAGGCLDPASFRQVGGGHVVVPVRGAGTR